MRRWYVLVLVSLTALAACAASPQENASHASAEAGRKHDIITLDDGCVADLTEVCETWLHRPDLLLSNVPSTSSDHLLETLHGRTQFMSLPVEGPNKEHFATIECELHAVGEHYRVVGARISAGTTIAPETAAYLKDRGLCTPNADTYGQEIKAQEDRQFRP